MQVAVMDLGTNVYNLLVAEVDGKSWKILHEAKLPARLGDGGLQNGILSENAFASATNTLTSLLSLIKDWGGVDKIVAFATSAVRDAQNREAFITHIKQHTGLEIEAISGDCEAALTCKGIQLGVPIHEPVLMLDIGGGSNEFMIADNRQLFWKHSFPIGMARLLEKFKPSNPIKPEEVARIEKYIDHELSLLWETMSNYTVRTLVGSSGTFETYRSMLNNGKINDGTYYEIDIEAYRRLHAVLLQSTTDERLLMQWMPAVRADFIVLASIFTNFVFAKTGIEKIIQSTYSLKEGAMQMVVERMMDEL